MALAAGRRRLGDWGRWDGHSSTYRFHAPASSSGSARARVKNSLVSVQNCKHARHWRAVGYWKHQQRLVRDTPGAREKTSIHQRISDSSWAALPMLHSRWMGYDGRNMIVGAGCPAFVDSYDRPLFCTQVPHATSVPSAV